MSSVTLEIITPERVVLSTTVNMVSVRTGGGELGILPRHFPLAATVTPGVVKVKVEEGEDFIAVSEGFLHVRPDRVVLLVDTAEVGWSIDVKRAEEAKQRAERRLAEKGTDIDTARAETALHRALYRLQAAEHSEKAGEWLKKAKDKSQSS